MTHLTPNFLLTKEDMFERAKKEANTKGTAYGVWEHVGSYGRPEGDIPARHSFRIRSLNDPDLPDDWALVGCVDPEEV